MIVIDLPADLNVEDDDGFHVAALPAGASIQPGQILVAGRVGGWAWALVHDPFTTAGGTFVRFASITAAEARKHGELIAEGHRSHGYEVSDLDARMLFMTQSQLREAIERRRARTAAPWFRPPGGP